MSSFIWNIADGYSDLMKKSGEFKQFSNFLLPFKQQCIQTLGKAMESSLTVYCTLVNIFSLVLMFLVHYLQFCKVRILAFSHFSSHQCWARNPACFSMLSSSRVRWPHSTMVCGWASSNGVTPFYDQQSL